MRRVFLRNILGLCIAVAIMIRFTVQVGACSNNLNSCSSSYGVTETYFGQGGSLCDPSSPNPADYEHSTNYCAKTAIGETVVGNPTSGSYQIRAGYNTARDPSLALFVNDSGCPFDYQSGGININLGALNIGSTTHYNINFSVKTYLASGYVISTVGTAPVSNGPSPYTLLTPTGSASPGTEKFGINLAANTGFGHGPQYLPDSTFSFGAAAAGYGTADSFKYNNGDTIASSSQSSGTTCYDMSYVFDISNVTPAGIYTMTQSIVATSTF